MTTKPLRHKYQKITKYKKKITEKDIQSQDTYLDQKLSN